MKSDKRMNVDQAELAVEANLSKFSNAVNHLEDKIVEGRAKVEKVKNIANKPKQMMNQLQDKAHNLTDKVSDRAHHLSDSVTSKTRPYLAQGRDYGNQFWNRAQANPIPYVIGAAALFGAMIYWMVENSDETEEELWGW